MNKTEEAAQVLLDAPEVKNRGHAFVILQKQGLTGSGAVFGGAVAAFEAERGVVLGKSRASKRADEDAVARAQAQQMSAEAVSDHISSIEKADRLFWACWRAFRDEGKWSNSLASADFAVHFVSKESA